MTHQVELNKSLRELNSRISALEHIKTSMEDLRPISLDAVRLYKITFKDYSFTASTESASPITQTVITMEQERGKIANAFIAVWNAFKKMLKAIKRGLVKFMNWLGNCKNEHDKANKMIERLWNSRDKSEVEAYVQVIKEGDKDVKDIDGKVTTKIFKYVCISTEDAKNFKAKTYANHIYKMENDVAVILPKVCIFCALKINEQIQALISSLSKSDADFKKVINDIDNGLRKEIDNAWRSAKWKDAAIKDDNKFRKFGPYLGGYVILDDVDSNGISTFACRIDKQNIDVKDIEKIEILGYFGWQKTQRACNKLVDSIVASTKSVNTAHDTLVKTSNYKGTDNWKNASDDKKQIVAKKLQKLLPASVTYLKVASRGLMYAAQAVRMHDTFGRVCAQGNKTTEERKESGELKENNID